MGADRKEPEFQEGQPGPDPSKEITRLRKELKLRSELARVVTSFRSPKELLPNILSILCEGFGANGGAIFFMDKDTDEIHLRSSYGLEPEYIIKYQKIHIGSHATGKVAETGEGMIIKDSEMDNRSTKGVVNILRYRSAVVTPVTSEGEVVGIIALISEKPEFFDEDDLKKLEFIGAHISLAIVNSFLNQQVRQEKERTLDILERLDEGIFEVELPEPMDIEEDQESLAIRFYQNARFNLLNPSFMRQSGSQLNIGDKMDKAFEEVQLFRMLKEVLNKGEVKGIERKWIGEKERLMEISMVRVKKEGRIKGIKGVRRDVTRRLKIEESMLEEKSSMELHLDLLSRELLEINSSVMGLFQVMEKKTDSPNELQRSIAHGMEEIKRSFRLINKVKRFSRISREETSPVSSDLSRKIRESFDIVKRQYPERIIEMEFTGADGEAMVVCDELMDELLEELFRVIIGNLQGERIGIHIDVKDWEYDGRKGYLLTISEGMSKSSKPFKRSEPDITWGLIESIVGRYKGKIWTEDGDKEKTKGQLRIMVFIPSEQN